jgi:hypothetical protein
MRLKIIRFVFFAAFAGPATLVAPAVAEPADTETPRLRLALGTTPGGDGAMPAIEVRGANGRYDRVASATVGLPLALSADFIATGSSFKILKSHLVLKSEGVGATSAVDLHADQGPVHALSRVDVFAFDLNPQGPVAQNAVALCNSLSGDPHSAGRQSIVSMGVAVRWQVTTGRFTFKWTDYDRVALSSEIVRNPDFYADQAMQDEEALIEVAVRCEPLGHEPAKIAMAQEPVHHAVMAEGPVAPVYTANLLPELDKPSCDGGMLRQVSSGAQNYVCLCPGNTTRIASGDNSFSCEKRLRRR